MEELLEGLQGSESEREKLVAAFFKKWKEKTPREAQVEISSHFQNKEFMTSLSSSLMSPSLSSPKLRQMICEWLCDTYNTKEHSLQLFVLCLLPALLWLFFSPSSDPTSRAASEATLLWIYNTEVAQCDTFEYNVVTDMVDSVFMSEEKKRILTSRNNDKRKHELHNQTPNNISKQTTHASPLLKMVGEGEEGEVVRRVMGKFNTHLSSVPLSTCSLMSEMWGLLVSCGFPFQPTVDPSPSSPSSSPSPPPIFPSDSVLEDIMDIVREPISEKKKEDKGKGKESKRKGKKEKEEEKEKEKEKEKEEEEEEEEGETPEQQREREFKGPMGKVLHRTSTLAASRDWSNKIQEGEICGIHLHISTQMVQIPFPVLQEVVKCLKFCLYVDDDKTRTKAKEALTLLHQRATADLNTELLLLTHHLL